jgi:cytochrome c oxidase assembly factor CtaG
MASGLNPRSTLDVVAINAPLLPPLAGHQFLQFDLEVLPLVLLGGALGLYLLGVRRVNQVQHRHPWPVYRSVSFVAGIATTALAIVGFLGVYDRTLFWDHMVQHLLLIMVAAPFFAIASPLRLLWKASTGDAHRIITEALRSAPAKFFGHPLTAFILYALVIPISHLTSFYEWTLTNDLVHDNEHLAFLVIGYLFWRQILGNEPNGYRLHPGLGMLYLFLAVPVDTFVGLSLAGESHEIFAAYSAMHRVWGPPLVTDLHIGGSLMWVVGDTLMLLPMIPLAIEWMHLEERRAVRIDRELDAAAGAPGQT